ncbi:MAG TPA: hypothetical protein VFE58_07915 [Tepidisphaeraceae bacterium]|jgi:hypothetical protein|nr:hypothetical protein [Tepidisphaeraceae bacterium]
MAEKISFIPFDKAIRVDLATNKAVKPANQKLVQTATAGGCDGEKCRALLNQYRDLEISKIDPLYALPEELITGIKTGIPGLLKPKEVDFERDLAHLCSVAAGAAGIVAGNTVPGAMLQPLLTIKPNYEEIVEASQQFKVQCRPDDIRKDLAQRLDPLITQRQGYLGWLLTNRQYLQERDLIRRHREAQRNWRSFESIPHEQSDPTFRLFLDRWHLCSLHCWDLPVPKMGDLAGIGLPGLAIGGTPGITGLSLSSVVGLPKGYPLAQMLEEQNRQSAPEHLAGWIQVLFDKKPPRGGVEHYQGVFFVHFYLKYVIRSRYGQRIRRCQGKIDDVIAEAFGKSPEWVRKIKATITARLGQNHSSSAD